MSCDWCKKCGERSTHAVLCVVCGTEYPNAAQHRCPYEGVDHANMHRETFRRLTLVEERLDELLRDRQQVPAWAVLAWIWDRREQYKPSSGTYEALSQILAGLAEGAHVEAWKHGELDDLRSDVERMPTPAQGEAKKGGA